jgi:hypothetical protein
MNVIERGWGAGVVVVNGSTLGSRAQRRPRRRHDPIAAAQPDDPLTGRPGLVPGATGDSEQTNLANRRPRAADPDTLTARAQCAKSDRHRRSPLPAAVQSRPQSSPLQSIRLNPDLTFTSVPNVRSRYKPVELVLAGLIPTAGGVECEPWHRRRGFRSSRGGWLPGRVWPARRTTGVCQSRRG